MRPFGGMEMLRIDEVIKESGSAVSLLFNPENITRWSDFVPGQFLMVWVPGVDEIPMSISRMEEEPLRAGITVQEVGDATEALCSLKKGDMIGIRGPYGRGFTLPGNDRFDSVLGVSGGVGSASTILLMERAHSEGFETINLVGARSADNILFRERWGRSSDRIHFSTDDGSLGHHGLVTDLLKERLSSMDDNERRRTRVITCGPEPMMVGVKDLLESFGVGGEFSLERFMKCGIGLCDSCSINGKRVCMDGPVFALEELEMMDEFGREHRDRSGRSVPVIEVVR